MAKVYNEEFKKQLVKERIQGKSYPSLEKEYGGCKANPFRMGKKIQRRTPNLTATHCKFPCLFPKRNPGSSQKNRRTGKGAPFSKKSRGVLRKGSEK